MNERIKALAEQAETYADEKSGAFRGEIYMRCFTEKFAELVRQDYLRELKALQLVAYMDSQGLLWNKTTHSRLHTALYALDGEQA